MIPYEKTIGNSFDEILFTNRNREYGAFVLRKKQHKYLTIAFFISFTLVTSWVISAVILNKNGNGPNREVAIPYNGTTDSTLIVIPPEPPRIDLEPMAGRFVPPVVVDTILNENISSLISMDDLVATNFSADPPKFITPAADDEVITIEERPFIKVEVPATFEGGDLNNFNKWVATHINYPQIAIETGITGKVFVQFVVNEKGKVSNVTVLKGTDPALDQEAVRVIQSSPEWTPPLQGGKPVKQLFTLPVTFKLQQ